MSLIYTIFFCLSDCDNISVEVFAEIYKIMDNCEVLTLFEVLSFLSVGTIIGTLYGNTICPFLTTMKARRRNIQRYQRVDDENPVTPSAIEQDSYQLSDGEDDFSDNEIINIEDQSDSSSEVENTDTDNEDDYIEEHCEETDQSNHCLYIQTEPMLRFIYQMGNMNHDMAGEM